ncbi:phenolphthiocerol synthesis polyketide synthase type I Pks15/1 domain protein [Mycobacterium kansasii 824]|nr:phenolphthiocerol synthesis polyketide synthase type I Pks15/1 domain protein [Mycobacterium kansasii 824]
MLAGQLSVTAQPWLADHAVAGVALFRVRDSRSSPSEPATRSAAPRWRS